MFDLLATVLAWFYELWPSYGMSIILLTLLVMLILTPLTLKGTRSMMMMQALQPEVKKLQARYKDDRQKLNEELLAFYRENKINPLGGCFPLLIQLPVFFVLYQVLYKLTRIGEDGNFNPSYLSHDSALDKALRGTNEMVSWGMDLSRSATKAMSESFGQSIPYLVLIVGVAATSYIQQKQVTGRNPNAPVNPQQQMLMRILPAFFAFISINFPAALVVYFLVSNLFRIGQQALISHTIYKPAMANGLFETKATDVTDAPAVQDKTTSTAKPSRASSSNPSVERRGFLDRLLGDGKARGETTTDAGPAKPAKAPAKAPAKPPAKRGSTNGASGSRAGGRTTPAGSAGARKKRKKKR